MEKQINRELRRVSNFSSLPVLIFTLLTQIISILLGLLFGFLNGQGIETGGAAQILITYAAVYLPGGGAALAAFYLTRGKQTGMSPFQLFKKPQRSVRWCLRWILSALACCYLANFITVIFSYLSKAAGLELSAPSPAFGEGALGVFTMFLALSVLAPLVEETLFRGTVYRGAEPAGELLAVVFSGVLFGLWHLNYAQLLYAAVLGCFSAFLVAKTRSIIPSLVLHAFVNTLSASLLLALSGENVDKLYESLNISSRGFSLEEAARLVAENAGTLIILELISFVVSGIIISGTVMLIIALVQNRKRKKFQSGAFPVEGAKKLGIFLSAPVTVITLAVLVIGTVYRALG